MAKITIDGTNMARGLPAPEGWYRGKLITFEIKPSKLNSGINYTPTFEFFDKNGLRREVRTWFFNLYLGIEFARFCTAMMNQELDKDKLDFDTDDIKIGTEAWIHISHDVYKGRITNKLDNFLPISAEVPTVPF